MHIPYESQILLVSRRLTYRLPPFFDGLQDLQLNSRRSDRRSLGKSAYKLVQELFSADLEVKWVATILDTNIEELDVLSIVLGRLFLRSRCLH